MPYSEQAYREFFESNINHSEKLKAVRIYLKNDRNADLFCDFTRPTPYTYFVYDEADNVTGRYGSASLWKVITNNVPIQSGGTFDLHVIDHIYRKASSFINN